MATKNAEAAKAAKQKKILIVLGVGLLAVGGLQGPKLLGKKDKAAAPAPVAATTTDPAAATATPTPVAPTAPVIEPIPLLPGEAGKRSPSTTLVGVSISSGSTVRASQGQLASFSLFKPKDPFAPQVTDAQGGSSETVKTKPAETAAVEPVKAPEPATAPVAAETPVVNQPTTAGPADPVAPTTPEKPPVVPVEPPKYATISVNGVTESLELGATFPKTEPLFVLARVKPKLVRIGIAGGKLEKGSTALVEVGGSITLVDSASGVRYVIKVISVGAQPDLAFTSVSTAAPTTTPAPSTP